MTPPSEIMLTLSVPDVGGMSEQCCRSALKSADLSLLVFHFARCWIYPPIPTDKSVDSLRSVRWPLHPPATYRLSPWGCRVGQHSNLLQQEL